jgi:hypothetical protein
MYLSQFISLYTVCLCLLLILPQELSSANSFMSLLWTRSSHKSYDKYVEFIVFSTRLPFVGRNEFHYTEFLVKLYCLCVQGYNRNSENVYVHAHNIRVSNIYLQLETEILFE